MIRELVACEHEYINTDHPDFIGGTRAVKVRVKIGPTAQVLRFASSNCRRAAAVTGAGVLHALCCLQHSTLQSLR